MAGKSAGGAKNTIYTIITLFILGGGILGWLHINNIHDGKGVYDYFRALSDKADKCSEGATTYTWNCERPNITGGSGSNINLPGSSTGTISIPGGGTIGEAVDKTGKAMNGAANKAINILPPTTPDAVNNAAPAINSSVDVLKNALSKTPVSNTASTTAYKRSEWRHWVGEPCNTRETVLKQQGKDVKTNPKTCAVVSGSWVSVYDGKKSTDASSLDIDHVIPLSYAAQHGGQSWPSTKKQQFANDVTQLIAVTANANRSKGDSGPSQYMPRDDFKCQYAKIWVSTATKYGVSFTQKDKSILSTTLNSCPKQ